MELQTYWYPYIWSEWDLQHIEDEAPCLWLSPQNYYWIVRGKKGMTFRKTDAKKALRGMTSLLLFFFFIFSIQSFWVPCTFFGEQQNQTILVVIIHSFGFLQLVHIGLLDYLPLHFIVYIIVYQRGSVDELCELPNPGTSKKQTGRDNMTT